MSNLYLVNKIACEALLCKFRPKIRHLIFHVTNRCNMRCRHCFVSFDNPKKELTFDEIKSISKSFQGIIWLDIGGGEPVLREDLEDIISLFNFEELSIPSNGWETELIVNRLEKINFMARGRLIITLSLEGMEKTHDEIRCFNSFKRTVQTFYRLKKIKGLRVKFNTVVCEKNCEEILDLMKFVKGLKPDFHSVIMLRGSPSDRSMRLPPIEKINSLGKDIYSIQQCYDYGRTGILSKIHRNYQVYKRNITSRILYEKKQVIPCLAGHSHLVIWPEGQVSACELLPPFGNIRERNMDELLNSAELKKTILSIKDGRCFCTHDCNMIENILFNPKTYLKLLIPLKKCKTK